MNRPKQDNEPSPDREPANGKPDAESDEACDDEVTITPPNEKVGEGEGNLGRRSDWFRKRTGR